MCLGIPGRVIRTYREHEVLMGKVDFAHEYGSPKCLVKVGCWGPVVNCNVTKRGWMAGIGGCPNVGGICTGCTMPGFPDKFMPFMDEPPGAKLSSKASTIYGKLIRRLRAITNHTGNVEPRWRHPHPELTTGYLMERQVIGGSIR